MSFLQNHPFAVKAWFDSSLVFTFAISKAEAQSLIPPALEPDCFEDQWAFLALAVVQTRKLRPRGFPAFLGRDFILAGYRVFVRYKTPQGKQLRGLYILRSETNKSSMVSLGNIFTHYQYAKTDIQFIQKKEKRIIRSVNSGFEFCIRDTSDHTALPIHSPFHDWTEARRFAGPLPFTFTWNNKKNKMLIVEGVRENWIPEPVEVHSFKTRVAADFGLTNPVLAGAFEVKQIPYCWKKGVFI